MKNVVYLISQYAFLWAAFLFSTSNAADSTVNYDTAWTYVYDGGKQTDSTPINDVFFDVKSFPNGSSYCVGQTADSLNFRGTFLVKLNAAGKMLWKKKYFRSGQGNSIVVAKNGDLILGGSRSSSPLIIRTDTAGNMKWSTWLYDSVQARSNPLSRSAVINSVRELENGSIICAAGDAYPNNNGLALTNYAAFIRVDSLGKNVVAAEWQNVVGYKIAGFSIEEITPNNYMIAGNQAVFYIDTVGNMVWKKNYIFSLDGVGSVVNNVMRVKKLRNGTIIAAGQAYEGNCWTRFRQLYYDGWWSPIAQAYGINSAWDTAGAQGGDDIIYDFAQLANGNLAFVGTKNFSTGSPVWTFVTDSTGKYILWEKLTIMPNPTTTVTYPMAVTATPDSGFTTVGWGSGFASGNGKDAFAMHFVPKAPSAVIKSNQLTSRPALSIRLHGKQLVVNVTSTITAVSLFDVAGKMVLFSRVKINNATNTTNASKLSKGTYFIKVKTDKQSLTRKIILN